MITEITSFIGTMTLGFGFFRILEYLLIGRKKETK